MIYKTILEPESLENIKKIQKLQKM